jgi:hypothetical protein
MTNHARHSKRSKAKQSEKAWHVQASLVQLAQTSVNFVTIQQRSLQSQHNHTWPVATWSTMLKSIGCINQLARAIKKGNYRPGSSSQTYGGANSSVRNSYCKKQCVVCLIVSHTSIHACFRPKLQHVACPAGRILSSSAGSKCCRLLCSLYPLRERSDQSSDLHKI